MKRLSWLDNIDLLVLDGFFDFTPVQGEMLRLLIQRIPNVIVNINYDDRNPQIFQTFQSTIEQLKSIADFEVIADAEPSQCRPARTAVQCERARAVTRRVMEGVSAAQDCNSRSNCSNAAIAKLSFAR